MNTPGNQRLLADTGPAMRRAVLAVGVFLAVVATASLLQQQAEPGQPQAVTIPG
jgi:hypothetical protein